MQSYGNRLLLEDVDFIDHHFQTKEENSSLKKDLVKFTKELESIESMKIRDKKVKLSKELKEQGYSVNYNDLLDTAAIVLSGV